MNNSWILIFVPACIISLVNVLTINNKCSSFKNTSYVPYRPPDYVFGIVWPILYITTGFALFYLSSAHLQYISIGFVCFVALWLVTYKCINKNAAAIHLIFIAVFGWILLYAMRQNVTSALLLTPLILWVTFAMYLNVYESFLSS